MLKHDILAYGQWIRGNPSIYIRPLYLAIIYPKNTSEDRDITWSCWWQPSHETKYFGGRRKKWGNRAHSITRVLLFFSRYLSVEFSSRTKKWVTSSTAWRHNCAKIVHYCACWVTKIDLVSHLRYMSCGSMLSKSCIHRRWSYFARSVRFEWDIGLKV